jgi:hypothetical protein
MSAGKESRASKRRAERTQILARLKESVAELAGLGRQTAEVTWRIATDLLALRETYPAGKEGQAAFVATATKATGYDESSIRSMVAAAEVRAALKGQAASDTADWTVHVMRAVFPSEKGLRTLKPAERSEIIRAVNREGAFKSEKAARAVRRAVLGEPVGGRKSTAKKTETLAKKLRKRVSELISNGHDPLDLATGARLAEEYGPGTADAILAIASALKEPSPEEVPATK